MSFATLDALIATLPPLHGEVLGPNMQLERLAMERNRFVLFHERGMPFLVLIEPSAHGKGWFLYVRQHMPIERWEQWGGYSALGPSTVVELPSGRRWTRANITLPWTPVPAATPMLARRDPWEWRED
jgi:hypothetical protein